ncbi:MAG: OmpH family outer membrane protein [Opitutales bacterium]|nr:OmpH family outer membrane protein [Opitutales bacterium]
MSQLKVFLSLFLFFVLLAPAVAAAQLKIGYVDLAVLYERAPQAGEASKALEREFGELQRELVAEQQTITALEQRLAEGDASEEEALRLERELGSRQSAFQRSVEQFEAGLTERRDSQRSRLQRLITSEIQHFSREEGFDLVVFEGVIYASNRVDISERILERLEARAR